MTRVPNPVRLVLAWIGRGLARFGIVDRDRADRTVALAWPRILTGIARTTKGAADVAMVGIAVGTAGVAGVGFAGPFRGVAFAAGQAVAGGTIALVSQHYGGEAARELGVAVRASALLAVAATAPFVLVFWLYPAELVALLTGADRPLEHGATYLRIVGLGVPFAGLNLVGSRVLVGCDDAFTAMGARGVGAAANVVLNAAFVFGLGWGVAGAAAGTVASNAAVTALLAAGLLRGRVPGLGSFPLQVSPLGGYADPGTLRDLAAIGVPVGLRKLVWVLAAFPMLAILDIFGPATVAAYVIARRITRVMNTPGWGFALAASSLVGQALGEHDERGAEAYGRDAIRFAVATYVLSALLVGLFAGQVVALFAGGSGGYALAVARNLVYAACVAVVFGGVSFTAAGALDASGDTRVPFVGQFLGMFAVSIPLAYLGATTALGLRGLYLGFVAQTAVPAAVNYWRFHTGRWKRVSEAYRPAASAAEN